MSNDSKSIGILTAGGDCQGLNAAIRGVAKAAINQYDMEVIGFLDGFRGLAENRYERLAGDSLSGILTLGGTILGTSRDKPHKMSVGDKVIDTIAQADANYHKLHLDALVCIGGGGTQKNAMRLLKKTDMKIITLPKTIDNDVWGTDACFGYDTAVEIATEAIDRLHSTASSHHRVMVVEVMGHNTGWLTAASGLAGGADVIVIPEIPYDIDVIKKSLIGRNRKGKRFSIVAVAEGARPKDNSEIPTEYEGSAAMHLTHRLAELTGLETRLTSLGHVMRGGTPSAADRILATKLGTKAVELIAQEKSGFMVAERGGYAVPVPLEEIAGNRRIIPDNHPLLNSLRSLGICLGE
ncbi:MAG: 6-phosphofructokinase [gamma proteobacterium symbiont of Bathyaustriella thionipta]|nr:6-phosphofructokinase [gamma proteobacterium symbiont of Bathyaustriella thionipta]MCU7949325.1 6-phosphofructokinase [gamma proteobacterium symbiont of Bathyaustriella thionipta]MCU7954911.1 6-phosphofructokinase [gamma proteobacterium symbiont of Bathyaustriella thionipta]MCU7955914.1 6-phosphofructokinase [gamma proteobacterium symbiont of Bathyaustriella thionipta]MCU7968196.1 6-phosphofructokinase [gamma proteobacterium symbiont of Bathyaustriella thionipta]